MDTPLHSLTQICLLLPLVLSPSPQVVETDEKIASIHYHSERFDWKAEGVFRYLQVRWGAPGAQCW